MSDLSPERQKALRRRRKHERQAVIFGTLIAGLTIAALSSAAVYTGVLSVPFLQRDFTTAEPEAAAAFPDAPCPPEGTLPVPYNTIQVNVLNGSGRTGLAGQTSSDLTARGFVVLTTGNYPTTLPAGAQISFGQTGVAAAYTLAAHLDAPLLLLDTRVDAGVDLVLGETYAGLRTPETVVLDPAAPVTPVTGCVPFEVALANALPAPTAPAPTDGAPADGTVVPPEEGVVEPPPAEEGAVEPAPEG